MICRQRQQGMEAARFCVRNAYTQIITIFRKSSDFLFHDAILLSRGFANSTSDFPEAKGVGDRAEAMADHVLRIEEDRPCDGIG